MPALKTYTQHHKFCPHDVHGSPESSEYRSVEFVLNVMLFKQFCNLVFMFGIVLTVALIRQVQAVSEELIEIVHSGKFLSLSDVRSMAQNGGKRKGVCATSPTVTGGCP